MLLITKTDIAESAATKLLLARLTALNPVAPQHLVVRGEASPDLVAMLLCERDRPVSRGAPTAHQRRAASKPVSAAGNAPRVSGALHVSDVWTLTLDLPEAIDRAALQCALQVICTRYRDEVLRVKGAVLLGGQSGAAAVQAVHDHLYPLEPLPAPVDETFTGYLVFIVATVDSARRAEVERAIRLALERLPGAVVGTPGRYTRRLISRSILSR